MQVSAQRVGTDEKGFNSLQGGLSAARRDMLMTIRAEEDEAWQDLQFCGYEVSDSKQVECYSEC